MSLDPPSVPLPDDAMDAGPLSGSTGVSSIGRIEDGDDNDDAQSAKRVRSETTSNNIDRDNQRRRIGTQDSDVVPTSDGADVGALYDIVDAAHPDSQVLPKTLDANDTSKVENTQTSIIESDDEDWYMDDAGTGIVTGTHEPHLEQSVDLINGVTGLHRILDLVSETGSGGLVDKIVIDQTSLGRFINDVQPGAYTSLVEVDFKSLDHVNVRPVGVYGSQSKIVDFLLSINAVDSETANALRASEDDPALPTTPRLRSGLYILRHESGNAEQPVLYVIFWPQTTTWNDDAESAVRRNRVTFIRYLTKICHQTMALVDADHASRIVWGTEDEVETMNVDGDDDDDDDDSDRMFSFEVAKTKEQDEDVHSKPGFTFHYGADRPVRPANLDITSHVDQQQPRTFLAYGDSDLGFVTVSHVAAAEQTLSFSDTKNRMQLTTFVSTGSFRLDGRISSDALSVLLDHGLEKRAPQQCQAFQASKSTALREETAAKAAREHERSEVLREFEAAHRPALHQGFLDSLARSFPGLDLGVSDVEAADNNRLRFKQLLETLPAIVKVYQDALSEHRLRHITHWSYKRRKGRFLLVESVLQNLLNDENGTEQTRRTLIDTIFDTYDVKDLAPAIRNASAGEGATAGLWQSLTSSAKAWLTGESNIEANIKAINKDGENMDDTVFLPRIAALANLEPLLVERVSEMNRMASKQLREVMDQKISHVLNRIKTTQRDNIRRMHEQELSQVRSEAIRYAQDLFLASTQDSFINDTRHIEIVQDIKSESRWGYSSSYGPRGGGQSYFVTGIRQKQKPPRRAYKLHVFQLTEGDKQRLQLEPSHVPTPRVHHGSAVQFSLPVECKILLLRLLPASNCLLIYDDGEGSILIYLEQAQSLGHAIQRGASKKLLRKDKLSGDPLFAYDESKRMLAVSVRRQLHMFVFDERYTTLLGLGSMIDLSPWYEGLSTISHITFAGGAGEELLLVDEHQNARIFSLITQQFRPTFVSLPEAPICILSSPDGSCFFSVTHSEGHSILRAYHWSNFGATNGIVIDLVNLPIGDCAITSFLKASTHFVTMVPDEEQLQSVSLSITRKVTEFSFQERGLSHSSREDVDVNITAHNCLIDCHADVWTRFPVVPAVRRRTVTSSTGIRPKALFFVTEQDHQAFLPYWQDLITQFERRTRKPTEKELSGIHALALSQEDLPAHIPGDISTLRAGEWLVDLLCLIPIHIAIARDNRFVPLKDGIFSANMERSLLGARVETIIDNISFGWYESIFRSYMSNKPVKVVSSMGEQSVGKSFALNHFVDTSFAGSAMRTTEGVWMSVTPTDDALVVAMDFEGVHSIERSAQEDTLLVLFNTAISNLVLFRNNFALSRDITGLFQSFQSSSTVLDPASNPDLFRSILTIIIKDVVDSDKKEITKEFSLKFQQIVQREQEANFISRLHRGRINIVPWPVIESKQFYTLFSSLKKVLDREPVTHPHAGVFIHTLKTLMAKLKANDWGSMSQNLAAHRGQILGAILPTAVAYGVAEVEPAREPLRNYDDQSILDVPDSDATFHIHRQPYDHLDVHGDSKDDPKRILNKLQTSWPGYVQRSEISEDEWMAGLGQYLDGLVQHRLSTVQSWILVNTSRFTDADASIGPLQRNFDQMAGDVKASVQMCSLKCTECHLKCLQARNHDGTHDCSTDHHCKRSCQYGEGHPNDVPCGMSAGHPGSHICNVAEHLCGEQCILHGKEGCMRSCVKMVGHERTDDQEHVCQASVHECGEPCGLHDVVLANRSRYSCQERCRKPSHELHDEHSCGMLSCPISCQLCTRLCSDRDHMHGLAAGAVHLCGQEHRCNSLCAAKGVCQIETQPQSIEATFTGRHERFQYTKYSQIHKRRPCVVVIPPGETEHNGAHTHDIGQAFHYCTTTCENCGYYCKLPYGHPQTEHETSHGSMSKTRWAIDGDTTVIQVQGRKFGANDDGAPMLCSLVCKDMGRHAHVDFCRSADPDTCAAAGLEHSATRMQPEPDRAKDWISHKLYWQRTGFKDPYSVDDQRSFEKCDALCAGPEHQPDAQGNPQPSYCTLPLFHPPHTGSVAPGAGYVSGDGHLFVCRNPAVMQNAFHVIFVIDRSGSMGYSDQRPLQGTPTTARISASCNNRLGSVYSSLYAFWTTRAAIHGQPGQAAIRRDAYSVVLFDDTIVIPMQNDFQSSPDQLLDMVLRYPASGGTNFNLALSNAQAIMERHWSTDRTPVVVFLSDGECSVNDSAVQDVSQRAITLGGNLSFHAVAFGPSIATLQRMVQLATTIQSRAPVDPMKPQVPSSYSAVMDTIRLAETFLGIADSLRKPRGSLMRG